MYRETGEPGVGFIAEDVAEAGLAEFVTFDENGQIAGLTYEHMVAPLLKLVQQLQKDVAELKKISAPCKF